MIKCGRIPLIAVFVSVGLWGAIDCTLINVRRAPAAGTETTDARPRPGDPRQFGIQRLKAALGVTDEEWNALEPKIEKVRSLQRQSQSRPRPEMPPMGGRGQGPDQAAGGPGGPGGPDGPGMGQGGMPPEPPQGDGGPGDAPPELNQGGERATTDVQAKAAALRTALNDKDATPQAIQSALSSYRQARDKTKADLAAAQKELKSLVTARQEAALVLEGLLD